MIITSKGNRNRAIRNDEREVLTERMTQDKAKKLMRKKINLALSESHDRFIEDEISVILWVLHETFGFGAEELKKYYMDYSDEWYKLKDHYEMSEDDMPWLCNKMLMDIGVDLAAWKAESMNTIIEVKK